MSVPIISNTLIIYLQIFIILVYLANCFHINENIILLLLIFQLLFLFDCDFYLN